METVWQTALWRQFGAALDMLDNAVAACPAALWTQPLWRTPPSEEFSPRFAEFWSVTFHALKWLDLYLAGISEEDFRPPAPFAGGELDAPEALPDRPHAKVELRDYLAVLRQTCHATLAALTDVQARRSVTYDWSQGQPISYWELQLYNLRHVQEHAAHLSLFLGQHGVPDEELDWVALAQDAPRSH